MCLPHDDQFANSFPMDGSGLEMWSFVFGMISLNIQRLILRIYRSLNKCFVP